MDRRSAHACPPGIAPGTLILPPSGWVPVERLAPGTHIDTADGVHHVARIDRYNVVPVVLVETDDGQRLRASGACRVRTPAPGDPRGCRWARVDTLRPGDLADTHLGPRRVAAVAADGADDVYQVHEPRTGTCIAGGLICLAGNAAADTFSSTRPA
jgi:hypothetical protein